MKKLLCLPRKLMPETLQFHHAEEKFVKMMDCMSAATCESFYERLLSLWAQPPFASAVGMPELPIPSAAALPEREFMMLADIERYLPEDLLVKTDRASMAHSLEVREPFLDYRLAEFAWSLPADYKLRGRETKRLLRGLLRGKMPPGLYERPKMGFSVPLAAWLRGPLRDWAQELLSERRLRAGEVFDHEIISSVWRSHLEGRCDNSRLLWPVLMFQAWDARL